MRPFAYLSQPWAHLTWPPCALTYTPRTHTENTHTLKNVFPPVSDRSHVDCVSIRRQEWLVISQGSDSQNGPSGTLCHSAWVRACPIDPAQLSKPMRDARLRSSRDGLCCQRLWMMYNIRMGLCYKLPARRQSVSCGFLKKLQRGGLQQWRPDVY